MIVKVHHQRRDGYIRGNVRWPRGTTYVDGQALAKLTDKQMKEVDADPAITLEQVKKAPEGVEVIKALDLMDPKAAAKGSGKTGNGGAAGGDGNKNKAPASPPPPAADKK